MSEKTIVIAGSAHLGYIRGMVYTVSKNHAGRYVAQAWRTLPGAPIGQAEEEGEKLYIATTNGDVLLSPDGTLEMAPCDRTGS